MQKRQVRKFVELATITSALSISLTGYAVAAVDMFIKIDGVKGESQDAKHKDEIDILAWSWGATNSGSTQSGGGGGSGKANIQDISITKYVDKASPLLLGKVCQGEHIKEATLTVRKAGGKNPVEYIKITLSDILVSSISTGGSGGADRLTENISLNFAKFKFEYTPQKADGSAEGTVPFAYDIKANKVCSLPEFFDGQNRLSDTGNMSVAQLINDFVGQNPDGDSSPRASISLQIKADGAK